MTGRRISRAAIAFAAAAIAFAAAAAAPAPAQQAPRIAPDREIMVMVPHPPDHFRPNSGYSGGYGDDLARSARERLARKIARQHGLALVEDWPMPMVGVDCFIMAVPADRSPADAAEQVSHDRRVAWSQPVQLYSARGAAPQHNDPLYPAQPTARQWQLASLHQLA